MIQRSPEWFAARLGKVTASRIADVMATLKKGGEAATRKNYRVQLAVERLTGCQEESFVSGAMQWGTEHEPFARQAYEFITGAEVTEVGFVDHPHIPMSGASPDGLVGTDGLIEIKCPNSATHVEYLMGGAVPSEYVKQMHWQMDCTGRQWCDFVSFDSRLPLELQLFQVRIHRDEALITEIRGAVIDLLQEVEEMTAALREKMAA